MRVIQIDTYKISLNSPVFVIAELSANHLQDFNLAKKTINAMKESGANAVKVQTFSGDTLTIKCDKNDFLITGNTLWDGNSLFDLYESAKMPWDWHKPLMDYAHKLGLSFFSTPTDNTSVDFLDKLNIGAFKIASFEITDIPLIRYAASKGKPMIISTGIATENDIDDAVNACLEVNNNNVILLKCTSAYPAPFEEVNLNAIKTLQKKYNCITGISDHTMGKIVPLGAVALGAKLIEKHFILDRKLGGPDASFSMEPHEFKEMVDSVRTLETALGSEELMLSKKIEKSRQFARSLYVVKDILPDEVLTNENVRSIRPGFGMKPKYMNQILGKTAKSFIEKGTALKEDLINL